MSQARRQVLIVIPTHRIKLKESEIFSLLACRKILGDYPTLVLTGDNHTDRDQVEFSGKFPGVELKCIAAEHFRTERSYNQLLLSGYFYDLFCDYEYLFIYQLDALVFKDQLLEWCEKRYDYIGAPLLNNYDPSGLWVVGNGGVSLRKTKTFQCVTGGNEFYQRHVGDIPVKMGLGYIVLLAIFKRLSKVLPARWLARSFLFVYAHTARNIHEDHFFSYFAQFFVEQFLKPSPFEAISFAIECRPREMLELVGLELPFACHNYLMYDKNYILQLADKAKIN